MKVQVLIIGAGASGLTAAIYAARAGCSVHILEAQERPAKKILATGNGKCNYTNRNMDISCYKSASINKAKAVIEKYPFEKAVEYLKEIGIYPLEREGYMYPSSGQASSVAECLLMEAKHLKVVIHTSSPVVSVSKSRELFQVKTKSGETFQSEYLVMSAGSQAGIKNAKEISSEGLCRSMGFKIQPCVPALTALHMKADGIGKIWSGVRVFAKVTLLEAGKIHACDQGEVQLTDYGISGIPVFQISRYASYAIHYKKRTEVQIDFMPAMTKEELLKEIIRRSRYKDRNAIGQLCGLWNVKLIQVLCKRCGINAEQPLKADHCRILSTIVKEFSITIVGTNPIEQAQVCAGGVDLTEIDENTMESQSVKGLYLTGELLDVDGICGGYNLHWAWATGTLAGKAIGKKCGKAFSKSDRNK